MSIILRGFTRRVDQPILLDDGRIYTAISVSPFRFEKKFGIVRPTAKMKYIANVQPLYALRTMQHII